MEILRAENLCKIYGTGETEVRAVDGISLSIEKGEFLAIVGASGSGKSTLLHMLGGVDRPTSGKIYMDGQDIYARNDEQMAVFRRRQIGLVYQFYNLIPVLNVVENITLPTRLDGRPVNMERLNELLSVLGLENRKDYLPNQLSGGQQQRVSIGRALMNAPAVVLANTGNNHKLYAGRISPAGIAFIKSYIRPADVSCRPLSQSRGQPEAQNPHRALLSPWSGCISCLTS